ncbi:hypothetical protein FA15DRAFT_745414 [Coprinopsis marcescibilis]|uniref:Uncharacterized protein n=1 Tax=Coprinopsis marcescibilis TaxID=230819 RepID=A0A5C3KSD6_COPMA|nr:hypothetical protein FA15DRAFT_745414 [Coprinopsis marcescibilis]
MYSPINAFMLLSIAALILNISPDGSPFITSVSAQSIESICWACPPTNAFNEPVIASSDIGGLISCEYGSGSCSYELNAGAVVDGDAGCVGTASLDCRARRAFRREAALPRSSRPINPNAVKPDVMRTRARLVKAKNRKSRN